MKQEYLQVRITEDEKAEVNDVIALLPNRDMTISQFVRDAVREKIADIRLRATTVGIDVTKDGLNAEDGNGRPVDLGEIGVSV